MKFVTVLLFLSFPSFVFAGTPRLIASSSIDGHPATSAFDKDPATYWQPKDGAPAWLEFQFDALTQVTQLDLSWKSSACEATLEGSVDHQTWRPVALLENTRRAPKRVDAVAQFFRIDFGPCAGGAAVAVREVGLNHRLPSLADKVNIFMGTSNEGPRFSRGNQYPAVHTPFGMAAWSVGSENLQSSWFYDYKDSVLTGIKLTHQPTVWGGDYAALDLMPMTGGLSADYLGRGSPYRRTNETAHPYYYRNTLDKYGITFEFVPSDRGAIFRFAYPIPAVAQLILGGASPDTASVVQVSPHAVEGHIKNGGIDLFFHAEFDRAISKLVPSSDRITGIEFGKATAGQPNTVVMKIASSYISTEQARDNLTLELTPHSLETLEAETKQKWEDKLGLVVVEGGRPEDQMTFYSTLYRTFAFPKMHWEPVGRDRSRSQYHSPFDDKTHTDRKLWTGNGFWDTYRALWPLYTILFPEQAGEMLDGLVNSYKDGGWTVRWSKPGYWECMVGTHTDIIFADAFAKGIRNWDYLAGYEASVKNAMVPGGRGDGTGRSFLQRSTFLGYVPSGATDQPGSRTIEDSVNDFGISVFARLLGKIDDSRYFQNRALAYTNLWDPGTRFFRGKDATGKWDFVDALDPYVWGYAWTEGNPWQYRFAPMHDGAGLVSLFGGRAGLEKALDEVMTADSHFGVGSYGSVIHEMTEAEVVGKLGFGQFAIGNEPVHHLLHMYAYAGRPSKTQYWTRRALTELYSSGYGDGAGYPGDEDEGEMSAWYVMNAMGFYSAAPGHSEYILGSPLFDSVTIHAGTSHAFQIVAKGNDAKHVYVQRATLDDQPFELTYLRHESVMRGGKLTLEMGESPSHWAEAESSMPSSMTAYGQTPRYLPAFTVGATVTGSGENPPGETLKQLVDADSNTKWLTFASHGYFQVQLARPAAARCYTMTSANDVPERDPKSWRLSASTDANRWQALDERSGVVWQNRQETKLFCFPNSQSFPFYRLEITENAGAAELQLAEFELR